MPKETIKKPNLRAVSNQSPAETDSSRPSSSSVCQKCFGSGMEVLPGKGARVCECRKRDGHTARLASAGIPKRYENCYFSSFREPNLSLKKAIKVASDIAQIFPGIDHGLLLTGNVGVGKTHLAVSIIHALTEKGISCLFYEFGSLLKKIQDSYNPNTKSSEFAVLAPVLNVDVLVLDELGAAKPTDWVQDTMYHIINSRYNDRKFTIFTTNYPDERPSDSRETLVDRIGVRTRSRIFEMCRTVVIDGDDYRKNFDARNRHI